MLTISPSTSSLLFSETQRFSKWWLLLTIEPLIVIIPVFFIQNVPWSTIAWVVPLTALTPALLQAATLRSEYHEDGLYLKYVPFKWKWRRIGREDIAQAYIRTYDPLGDYGGWGYKKMDKNTGWCYNARGKVGLQLVLKDGSKILVGTQDSHTVSEVLTYWNIPTKS